MGTERRPQRRSNNRNMVYIDGNNARKLMPVPEREQDVRIVRERNRKAKKTEKTAKAISVNRGVDFLSMIFLTSVLVVTIFACIKYLDLQSELKQMDKTILTLENDLDNLIDKNNSIAIEFDKEIDFEYIYQIAVGELGMVFPNNNQVISYEKKIYEYVRQYEIIEDVKISTLLDKLFP